MGPNFKSNSTIIIVCEGLSAGQVWHSRSKTGTKRMRHGGRAGQGQWG